MLFLSILLGSIIGVLIVCYILYVVIKNKIKTLGSYYGYSSNEIKDMIKEGEYESIHRKKTVSGMTKFIVPKIQRDFPEFNESMLFSKVELSIRGILNSLSNGNVEDIKELKLIKTSLLSEINSLNGDNIIYDNIKFHDHAIKDYENVNGALTITVESSLEYYYERKHDDKIIVKRSEFPKQSAFITKYVYIYDIDKYDGVEVLGVNCPNCGAPIKTIGNKYCEYCGSGIKSVDLKSWYISSYKEKY